MAALGMFVYFELKQRYKRLQLFAEKINILPTDALFYRISQLPYNSIIIGL